MLIDEISQLKEENKKLKLLLSVARTCIDEIIYSNSAGGCLCGHNEWCENCSPNSSKNEMERELIKIKKLIQ